MVIASETWISDASFEKLDCEISTVSSSLPVGSRPGNWGYPCFFNQSSKSGTTVNRTFWKRSGFGVSKALRSSCMAGR